jgi:segregation and condensation protein A
VTAVPPVTGDAGHPSRLGYGAGVAESREEPEAVVERSGFRVHLEVFEGPFDLLLGLIAKHQLDITEVALSKVTDEFIGYIRGHGPEWDLGQATEFLVVAATLLDLKAARLLPTGEVEDEEDLAVLEARDLLFARLLQYRAFKQVAAIFAARLADEARRYPRTVGLEPPFSDLLPEVLIGLRPEDFARLAARTLAPRPEPRLPVTHLHAPRVSVREQALLLVGRLRRTGGATFRTLVADSTGPHVVVARFLALLELYKESAVAFEQVAAFGELHVRWTGGQEGRVELDDEFDEGDGPDEPRVPDGGTNGGTDSGMDGGMDSGIEERASQ